MRDLESEPLTLCAPTFTAHLDLLHYPTGVEPAPEQLQALRLQLGEILPKWNYTISPHL